MPGPNPLKSRFLARRLAVKWAKRGLPRHPAQPPSARGSVTPRPPTFSSLADRHLPWGLSPSFPWGPLPIFCPFHARADCFPRRPWTARVYDRSLPPPPRLEGLRGAFRRRPQRPAGAAGASERDKMGSALTGSLQISCFLTGIFGVLRVTCLYLPKSARVYLFPQPVKIPYFCSGPINVDPICPQPSTAKGRFGGFQSTVRSAVAADVLLQLLSYTPAS